MNNNFTIQFKKWHDPLKAIYEQYKKNKGDDEFDKSDFSDMYEYHGPVMQTPHGVIPINEANLPSTVFNFWRADTNFLLTKPLVFIIQMTLGVETFDVITPYRFRIAVGTLFDEDDVKERVNRNVYDYLNKFKKSDIAHTMMPKTKKIDIELLRKQFTLFAVVENGVTKIIHGNTKEEIENKVKDYLVTHKDGKAFYSWK
jgi:hypothetical protein